MSWDPPLAKHDLYVCTQKHWTTCQLNMWHTLTPMGHSTVWYMIYMAVHKLAIKPLVSMPMRDVCHSQAYPSSFEGQTHIQPSTGY